MGHGVIWPVCIMLMSSPFTRIPWLPLWVCFTWVLGFSSLRSRDRFWWWLPGAGPLPCSRSTTPPHHMTLLTISPHISQGRLPSRFLHAATTTWQPGCHFPPFQVCPRRKHGVFYISLSGWHSCSSEPFPLGQLTMFPSSSSSRQFLFEELLILSGWIPNIWIQSHG